MILDTLKFCVFFSVSRLSDAKWPKTLMKPALKKGSVSLINAVVYVDLHKMISWICNKEALEKILIELRSFFRSLIK